MLASLGFVSPALSSYFWMHFLSGLSLDKTHWLSLRPAHVHMRSSTLRLNLLLCTSNLKLMRLHSSSFILDHEGSRQKHVLYSCMFCPATRLHTICSRFDTQYFSQSLFKQSNSLPPFEKYALHKACLGQWILAILKWIIRLRFLPPGLPFASAGARSVNNF